MRYLLLLAVAFAAQIAEAQVQGVVLDATSGEALPFVNVMIVDSEVGTTTDLEGNFNLPAHMGDTLVFSFIGYQSFRILVESSSISIQLKESVEMLEELVVRSKDYKNPAIAFMRSVFEAKEVNRHKEAIEHSKYEQMSLSLSGVTSENRKEGVLKHLNFLIDTSHMDRDIPLFISEDFSEITLSEEAVSTNLIDRKVSGVGIDQDLIATYMSDLIPNIDVYDNNWTLASKQFVSPISKQGLLHYDYYFLDSITDEDSKIFELKVQPKRQGELNLEGVIRISGNDHDIVSMDLRMSETANVNFIKGFDLRYNTAKIEGKRQLQEQCLKFKAPFSSSDSSGSGVDMTLTIVEMREYSRESGLEILADKNSEIQHQRIEELNNSKKVKALKKVVNTFSTAYLNLGKVEIGPYYNLFSYNAIEGERFSLTGRTSKHFSHRIQFNGAVGYGVKDQKVKHRVSMRYKPTQESNTSFEVEQYSDLIHLGVNKKSEFLTENKSLVSEDNIISSLLRRRPNDKMVYQKGLSVSVDQYWNNSLSTKLYLEHNTISKMKMLPIVGVKGGAYDRISINSITLNNRLSFGEKVLRGNFRNIRVYSNWPIFNLNTTVGKVSGTAETTGANYAKLNLVVKQKISIPTLGQFKYVVDAGTIQGKVPFHLLELHSGNETYSFYRYSSNLMNYYEFASTEYLNCYAEHHFEGLFLNKVPLIKKLKWREVVSGRVIIGELEEEKLSTRLPSITSELNNPYYEVGVGLENIFKVFRVEFVQRLTHRDAPNTANWGIRGRMQIQF